MFGFDSIGLYISGAFLLLSILLSVFIVYRIGYIKGFKKGSILVLDEWKKWIRGEDDDN